MLFEMTIVYLYLFIQTCFVFGAYRYYKNPSIIDAAWPIGLMNSGLVYLYFRELNFRTIVIAILLVVWAFRLFSYLWITRVSKGHVDKRYLELSEDWKISKSLGFFLNFQLQAILVWIISIIFLFVGNQSYFSIGDKIGILLILVGIVGESYADWQLQKFKLSSINKRKVCDIGLWQYSRHPNYFFDWLTWCGFSCFALNNQLGLIALVSPALLFIIFTRITGPMTERSSVKSKGQAFIDYQNKTSFFFPFIR